MSKKVKVLISLLVATGLLTAASTAVVMAQDEQTLPDEQQTQQQLQLKDCEQLQLQDCEQVKQQTQ